MSEMSAIENIVALSVGSDAAQVKAAINDALQQKVMVTLEKIGIGAAGLVGLTFLLIIISGLGIITHKLFNHDTISLECPDVDINDTHILNNINYVKLNASSNNKIKISKEVIALNDTNLNIVRMSMVILWIVIISGVIGGIYFKYKS